MNTGGGRVTFPKKAHTMLALPFGQRYLVWFIIGLQVAGRELRIAQHQNSELAGLGTGGAVWDAAVALCKYLGQGPSQAKKIATEAPSFHAPLSHFHLGLWLLF